MNDLFLTIEQLEKTKKEYEYYIQVKRPEVVERIKEAKSYGDLSENSEYDSAREEQAFVEAKIKELDAIISNAKIIEAVENSEFIAMGTIAVYKDLEDNKKYEFRIVGVGANPLDPENPSISTATPLARGLLGHAVGDIVEISIPSGTKKVEILEIK